MCRCYSMLQFVNKFKREASESTLQPGFGGPQQQPTQVEIPCTGTARMMITADSCVRSVSFLQVALC